MTKIPEKNYSVIYFTILLIVSIVSHFPFVLKGFGELDATKIAVSVIDMINNGSNAAFANFYFTDVIPLYILYLKSFMKLLNYNYSYLPLIMNYTNVIVGILIIVPTYLLINRLFNNQIITFCSILTLLFAPSFYQATIMGFPHLISFFFLLASFLIYVSGIDHSHGKSFLLKMFLTYILLTTALLFKSDYILASGFYIGILFIRKIKDKTKIISPFIIIGFSGILFIIFRRLILGPTGGTTMTREALLRWYHFSLAIPRTLDGFILQVGPIAYAFGIATFFLSIISLIYLLYKKRFDILIFVLSWSALPTFFWAIMIGNNARHNMLSVLPAIVSIVSFFYDRFKKGVVILTIMLILANYLILPPSPSIIRPSGNITGSVKLIKERMNRFREDAVKIAHLDEKKIAVLGYFHNPHVIFEILKSTPVYKAEKIGREDYRIKTDDREYVFIYFVLIKPEEELIPDTKKVIEKYFLHDYTFVSATYDLKPLDTIGIKAVTIDVIKKSEL
ncbi:MAG: hypothetical protein QXT99_09200 [Candidatus Nitrosotenuis sp.]